MSIYGRRTASKPRVGTKSTANFDHLWEEEEDAAAAEPEEGEPVPAMPATPLYIPSQREIMSVRRLHNSWSDAEIVAYLQRKHAHSASTGSSESPRHISSDDALPPQPSQHWAPRAYQHEQAISSAQLFPEQSRVGLRATLKSALFQVLSEFAEPNPEDIVQ